VEDDGSEKSAPRAGCKRGFVARGRSIVFFGKPSACREQGNSAPSKGKRARSHAELMKNLLRC